MSWAWLCRLDLWGFIIGLAALALTVPSVFQMSWGRPKVRIGLTRAPLPDHAGIEVLGCELTNQRITNRALRFLRVKRDPAEDVTATYEIKDAVTKTLVFKAAPLIAINQPWALASSQHARIPVSAVPCTFRIVTISPEGNERVFAIHSDGALQALSPGLYDVSVYLEIDGDVKKSKRRRFLVQDHPPYAEWV